MLSEKQLAVNRANAQLSTGPKSEDGKRISRMNARRHDLTGQVTSMTPEDRIAHDAFSEALIKAMSPEGALELQFAQRVATDSWRLNRSSAIEDNIFALGFSAHADRNIDHPEIQAAFAAARTFTAEAKSIELLTLYEQRINRGLQRNLALLQTLQATRKAERQAEIDAALKLLQLSAMKGVQDEPAKSADATGDSSSSNDSSATRDPSRDSDESNENGFVFSTSQIHAVTDPARRLEHAEPIDSHQRSHGKHDESKTQAA